MELRSWPAAHPPPAGPPPGDEPIWHELECGGYETDLPVWLELAAEAVPEPGSEPLLEAGAGTGRVTLALARRGHRVTAVEHDPVLLAELERRARAEDLEVEAVAADARELRLAHRGYALVVVPMQTIQLFGDARGRGRFLAAARAHMRPGGLLACAIVHELESFSVADGDPGPEPERLQAAGRLYVSVPTAVRVGAQTFTIERERRVLDAAGTPIGRPRPYAIEAARLTAPELEAEGAAAGLLVLARREVADTEDHLGSTVVVLRA